MFLHCIFYKCLELLFCIGIFNSKNLPIFLLRRFIPLFIIPLFTLEVNDFQPMEITPAYAGKRPSTTCKQSVCGDHSRLCGEKDLTKDALHWYKGSPPPMRGKGGKNIDTLHVTRITPAYAGKSAVQWHSPASGWDHPRLCGEKCVFQCFLPCVGGSPPPMRGKVSNDSL